MPSQVTIFTIPGDNTYEYIQKGDKWYARNKNESKEFNIPMSEQAVLNIQRSAKPTRFQSVDTNKKGNYIIPKATIGQPKYEDGWVGGEAKLRKGSNQEYSNPYGRNTYELGSQGMDDEQMPLQQTTMQNSNNNSDNDILGQDNNITTQNDAENDAEYDLWNQRFDAERANQMPEYATNKDKERNFFINRGSKGAFDKINADFLAEDKYRQNREAQLPNYRKNYKTEYDVQAGKEPLNSKEFKMPAPEYNTPGSMGAPTNAEEKAFTNPKTMPKYLKDYYGEILLEDKKRKDRLRKSKQSKKQSK
jgi:hypothetical protein